ncbi:MAG: hypothetical protein HZC54_11385 [Verrucomicrobia bacterium]|nr:hypothetical protein [Verrucomicrobiota bacterium]
MAWAQLLLARVERQAAPPEPLSEPASKTARALPELAAVRRLERRAFPVSQAQAVSSRLAQAQWQEPPVVQPSQSPELRAVRQVARPVRWQERGLPARLASQQLSSLAFLPQQARASQGQAARAFPARTALSRLRRLPFALPAAIVARIPAPCCPASDKAAQRRRSPSPG